MDSPTDRPCNKLHKDRWTPFYREHRGPRLGLLLLLLVLVLFLLLLLLLLLLFSDESREEKRNFSFLG